MNYQEAINWILSFTDYEQLPGSLYSSDNFDLRRMVDLLRRLGDPHRTSRTIHIAGSKGKGSTAAMISSVLTEAGYTVGLFTSPHLHTMRERIAVNNQLITEQELTSLVESMLPEVEAINLDSLYGCLTTFEILTALAFLYFPRQKVDFQVMEVGLGGRLDATNVVNADVSVITSISIDHSAILGSTLEAIAREKAGIIKSAAPVVVAPQKPEVVKVIEEVCHEKGAVITLAGRDIHWQEEYADLSSQSISIEGRKANYEFRLPLLGAHQAENASIAVAVLEILGINPRYIVSGLNKVHWPGRIEILQHKPLVMVDGAHNPDSTRRLVEAIKQHFTYDHLILIVGISSDKDIAGIITQLAPLCDSAFIARSRHPRSAEPSVLAKEFAKYGINALITGNVAETVSRAIKTAGPADMICATGSLFIVAEVIEYIKGLYPEVYSL